MANIPHSKQDENNEYIRLLAAHYPKCFVEEPRQRRPLKHNIAADIKKDTTFDVTPEKITDAVEWYQSHIGYAYQSRVQGTFRIDLNGNGVSTVTEAEALAAQQRVDDFNLEKRERNAALGVGMIRNGVSDRPVPLPHKAKAAAIAPEFAALFEFLNAVNVSVIGSDPSMRAMVAKMLLNKVIRKFQQVESEMEE
jgi:sRNA-binding protein